MTTIRKQTGPLGAALRSGPSADAPVMLHLPEGTILEGELAHGEELYGDNRYLALFVWVGRMVDVVDVVEDVSRARRRRRGS